MDYEKTAGIGLFHRDASADQVSKSLKHHVNNLHTVVYLF